MMRRLDALLVRLAGPDGAKLFDEGSRRIARLRLVARIAFRYFWIYVVVTLLSLIVVAASGMDVYHRTEMPRFCNVCHEMGGNFKSWEVSLHKSSKCVDCHARPGVTGWLSAKLNGTRQLLTHFTAKSIADIRLNEHQRKTLTDNCRRCHLAATRVNERQGIVMNHARHLDLQIDCVQCHTRAFAHPDPAVADKKSAFNMSASCMACHDGKTAVSNATAFALTDEKNCTRCHADAGLANNHGGRSHECTECHEARKDAHFSLPPKGGSEICTTCHDPETKHASFHEPYKAGRCNDCHRVMSPAHLYLAGSKPSAGACLTCHEEQTARLNGDARVKPTRFRDGDKDLHRKHREKLEEHQDWCLGCHAGHGSDAPVAFLKLRELGAKGKEPKLGTFAQLPEKDGGTCATACHDKPVSYRRSREPGK